MHIGLFGRRNAGKSSLLNALVGQQASIVSPHAGTTTDPVDKAMELLPLGPVLFVDTAGIDDEGELGALRTQETLRTIARCDVALLVVQAGTWTSHDTELAKLLGERGIPVVAALIKIDLLPGGREAGVAEALARFERDKPAGFDPAAVVTVSALDGTGLPELRQALIAAAPEQFIDDPHLVGDIVPAGSVVVLVVPLDKEAPKGRLILPQVQTIRDLLENPMDILL